MNNDDTSITIGKIEKVFSGKEDHGLLTTSVMIEFGGGGSFQSFGNLALNADLIEDFNRDLWTAFDKKPGEDIVGEPIRAWRCFPEYWSVQIEAIQSLRTKRWFVLNEWRRKHFPATKSPLEEERERCEDRIHYAQTMLDNWTQALRTLDSRYSPVPR